METNLNIMRKFIFNLLFTPKQKIWIIHALWMVSFDNSPHFSESVNAQKKEICEKLAREFGI